MGMGREGRGGGGGQRVVGRAVFKGMVVTCSWTSMRGRTPAQGCEALRPEACTPQTVQFCTVRTDCTVQFCTVLHVMYCMIKLEWTCTVHTKRTVDSNRGVCFFFTPRMGTYRLSHFGTVVCGPCCPARGPVRGCLHPHIATESVFRSQILVMWLR